MRSRMKISPDSRRPRSLPAAECLSSFSEWDRCAGRIMNASTRLMISTRISTMGTTRRTLPMSPASPASGPSTHTVVRNDDTTPPATSRAPWTAASSGGRPRARCAAMFSAMTMPSSMRMPMASSRPTSEIMLIVMSRCGMNTNAPKNDTGRLMTTQKLSRRLKNIHMAAKTSSMPCQPLRISMCSRSRTSVDVSWLMANCTLGCSARS